MGKMFFNILATFAEFEVDLLRCAHAKAWPSPARKAASRAANRKLSAKQRGELRRMHKTGNYTITDLAELFRVSRPTVYRTLAAAEHVAAQGN